MYRSPESRLPKTLSYHFFDEIRKRIIKGVFRPGYPLREQELEAELGSSRGPIRESLRLLLNSGLVECQPRRGFRVKEYSEKNLDHLYHLRAILEGMVIESLAELDVDDLIPELRASLDRMDQMFEAKDLDGYFWENILFHQKIIDFAGNEPLASVIYYVNEMSLPARYLLLGENFPNSRSINYHKEIVDGIAKRDFKKSCKIGKLHILENLETLKWLYMEEKKKSQHSRFENMSKRYESR